MGRAQLYRVVGGKVVRAQQQRVVGGRAVAAAVYRVPGTAVVTPPEPVDDAMQISVNVHPLWTDWPKSGSILDLLQAAGVRHVRADFGWSDLQPTSANVFGGSGSRVAEIDTFMTQCDARGIKVLAMIYKPPFWSSGSGTASNPAKNGIPANAADFGRVLAWFIDRYKTKLKGVEMFNEMDISTFSLSRDPVDYVRIMKGGYAGAAGRGVPLVAGAPTYIGLATGWLAACYAAGLGNQTHDALALHPYMSPSNVSPTGNASGSARKWSIVGIADVNTLRAGYGDTKPIWATEFGWSSHANVGGEANYQLGVTQAEQATYLTNGFAALDAQGVEYACWYSDRNTNESSPQEANFGVLNYDLSAKPAYTALAALPKP